ncbi:MAG: ribbon-helix-helix domain-containing protein [Verrucomicrobia bacterium]|nr:ribbon-helix-helix domain-containing protein [Verrucomicrobiota bacterium]
MKTITIKVPEELDARLAMRAKRRGVSKSEVAREAFVQLLGDKSQESVEEEPSAYDILKDDLGCIDSGIGDLSTNPKHMEGFGK